MTDQNKISEWNNKFSDATPIEVLNYFLDEFGDKIALSTSLGMGCGVSISSIGSSVIDLMRLRLHFLFLSVQRFHL